MGQRHAKRLPKGMKPIRPGELVQFHRGVAVHEHERRPGAGVFCGWHCRGHHHCLSRFKWLFVIARNSSFTYKGRAVDVKQVGRELGVRYVLEGSIRRASRQVRISGQLIDAVTGDHLWVDRFDGAVDDIFQLQHDVSGSVANAIAPKMEQVETERAKRKPLQHLGAYDFLLRARAIYQGNSWRPKDGPADVDEAHRLLLQALELDAEFAPAYAAAAQTFSIRKANHWVLDRDREVAEADRFARAVGRFGADDPAALCVAGSALAHVVRDVDAGSSYTDRALTLAPNLAIANLYGALVSMWRGDSELAITRLNRAIRLSPLDPMLFAMHDTMAQAHFAARRYAEAVLCAEASLAEQPNNSIATRILASLRRRLHPQRQRGGEWSFGETSFAQAVLLALNHLLRIRPENFLKIGYAEGRDEPRQFLYGTSSLRRAHGAITRGTFVRL